jgi:hypothetical protein
MPFYLAIIRFYLGDYGILVDIPSPADKNPNLIFGKEKRSQPQLEFVNSNPYLNLR